MKSLHDKSVLVTAGAGGIGRYIVASFVNAGACVHIVDVDKSALVTLKSDLASSDFPEALVTQADVSKEDQVERIFSRHFEQFDGIEVLVNCAGSAGPTALAEQVSLADWRECFAVNLDATFMCSRKAIPAMKQKRAGRIINISSTAGWHGYPLRAAYCAAKWAVIGLTKSLSMELGQYGITANVICPGSVDGERMDRVIAAEAKEKEISEQEVRRNYTRSCSMRTFISGQDIADMALFLASENAAKVTGQIMNVDGHLEHYGGLDDMTIDDMTVARGEAR
ncbi:SDR family oxidoreductase [Candidatus Spongiihabitans sp.]|uniref:SDR family oxidoreductase n=1 Tax=Candidatus Spongiihabitans sp. TaxID=3101308 RepID=UPI003C7B5742